MAEFHPVRETIFIASAAILAGVVAVLVFPDRPRTAILAVLGFLLFVFLGLALYLGFRGAYSLRRE